MNLQEALYANKTEKVRLSPDFPCGAGPWFEIGELALLKSFSMYQVFQSWQSESGSEPKGHERIGFPPHKCGLYVTHNSHKDYYQSLKQHIVDNDVEFDSEAEKKLAIETDSLWEIQWYPSTPVGSYTVYAATFEKCLSLTNFPGNDQ